MEKSLIDFISQYVTLTDEEAGELLSLGVIRSYRKGTMLLEEGESTRLSYFVLKGCVVRYYLVDGEIKVAAIYTENEAVLPAENPSKFFLYVVEDSILSAGDAETADLYMKKFPKLETMCRMMAEKTLSKYQFSFDQYRTSTPEQRYRHLAENRPDLLQRVPQYYLASYLGIRPESLSRIRRRLASKPAPAAG
jgi:CRP-like cAMP-binding protein